MCGIAGIARHPDNQQFDLTTLEKASKALSHRGPDDEGFLIYSDNEIHELGGFNSSKEWLLKYKPTRVDECRKPFSIGLLHRRLSIIDTGAQGHQPFCDSQKRYWITFNGEIYNYKSLRKTLEQKGYTFKSQTDTEVLLYAYLEWREQCEQYLRGMWAFVIYDSQQQTLFASRDRNGVKPLYYVLQDKFLAFASEQSVFHKAGWLDFEVNKKAVFDFLYSDLLEHEPEGLFKHVHELQPAHHFTYQITTGELQLTCYFKSEWNNTFSKIDEALSKKYIQLINEACTQSISEHLQSDVPVGTCLSGGIDSSILVSVISNLMQNQNLHTGSTQHAFHASFSISNINETHFAEEVVKEKPITLHIVQPSVDELAYDLEKLISTQNLPLRSFSTYAQYRVMQLAHQSGIKVLIDGQGADELFGGYYRYIPNYLYNAQQAYGKYYVTELKKQFFPKKSIQNSFDRYLFKELLKSGSMRHVIDAFHPAYKLLNKDLFIKNSTNHEAPMLQVEFNRRLHIDFYGNYLKELLYREDRSAMAHSIESRVPFTDDLELSKLVFSIAGIYKMQSGISKYLLREAFKDVLPKTIFLRRDKLGFSSPNNLWMSALKEVWLGYLHKDLAEFYHLKNFEKFIRKLDKFENKPENYKTLKWLMFPVWLSVMSRSKD